MKKTIFLIFILTNLSCNHLHSQTNIEVVSTLEYDQTVRNVTGYVSAEGTEYAIVYTNTGLSIVDLDDPSQPTVVLSMPSESPNALHRTPGMVTYGTYLYRINSDETGLEIVNLSGLPASVEIENWKLDLDGENTLSFCDDMYVDEFGYLYLAGCQINNGGLIILNVFTQPGNPVFVGLGPALRTRSVFVKDNMAYAAEDQLSIYDVTNKENIVKVNSGDFGGYVTHIGVRENTVFTGELIPTTPLSSYNLDNTLTEIDQHLPQTSVYFDYTVQDLYVQDEFVHIMYASDGYIIFDSSRPDNLVEIASFNIQDNFDSPASNFYPFLPSGHVLLSHSELGLVVIKPTYQNACWVEGIVTSLGTEERLAHVDIKIDNLQLSEITDLGGRYCTGHHQAGTYVIKASKFGYHPVEREIELIRGQVTNMDIELVPVELVSVQGQVVEVEGQGIEGVRILLQSDSLTYKVTTDNTGSFILDGVLPDRYQVDVLSWGYIFSEIDSIDVHDNNNPIRIEGKRGYEDDFTFDLGWDVSDGLTQSGRWDRIHVSQVEREYFGPEVDPNSVTNTSYILANVFCNFQCNITSDSAILSSPYFDVSSYNRPVIQFNYWGYYFPNDSDRMIVELSNGEQSIIIDDLFDDLMDPMQWSPVEIDINAYLPLSPTMKVRFISTGLAIAQVGIDDVAIVDTEPTSNDKDFLTRTNANIYPNPTDYDFTLALDFDVESRYELVVYDVMGNVLLREEIWNKDYTFGEELAPGIYFAQISSSQSTSQSIRLVKGSKH